MKVRFILAAFLFLLSFPIVVVSVVNGRLIPDLFGLQFIASILIFVWPVKSKKFHYWLGWVLVIVLPLLCLYQLSQLLPHWSEASSKDKYFFYVSGVFCLIAVPLIVWEQVTGVSLKTRWKRWRRG